MNKKLDKHLQNMIKDKKLSKESLEGGAYVRNVYDTALSELFGKKIGIKISDYLIEMGIKKNKKQKKSKKE